MTKNNDENQTSVFIILLFLIGTDLVMGSYTPDEVDIKVTIDKTLYKKKSFQQ